MKKWLKVLVFFVVSMLFFTGASPAVAKDVVQWKSEETQWIRGSKWTTLDFNGKTAIPKTKRNRALYCSQLGIKFGKKKPRYVKLRFARVLPSGKLDTTGTNTWILGKNAPNSWHGSICWSISSKYPVVVQAKIADGGKYRSHLRQFKAWSPSSDFPTEFLTELQPHS